ncbi:hypothetical protein BHS09_26545 [Myxococcus xanthus]|uniref:Uncharacterized protein n=1 Tax=Myxococcus xanthus TaxID=34 RepID=A0AAE6G3C4_MYXXA|nr:hypothetical protein BHS09_26545 [Myxococcus xanthus]QDE77522.1 hypothetical protein BHS08_26565 [Myxococcus xanthus]
MIFFSRFAMPGFVTPITYPDWMKDSMRFADVALQSGATADAFVAVVEFGAALFAVEDEPMPSRLRIA